MKNPLRTRVGRIVVGAAILLTALWGGAYALSLLDPEDWREFPILVTAVLLGIVGYLLATFSLLARDGD